MRARFLPYLAVALAACAWGTWGAIIRKADAMAPGTPVALQSTLVMAVTTVVTGVAAVRNRTPGPVSWRIRGWVVWLGISDALNILLFFAAYKHTLGVSVLAHYLAPIFVACSAPFVLKERMTARVAVAIGVSFSGLAVMLLPAIGGARAATAGVSALLGAGSAAFYASNVVVNKFVTADLSTSETMFWHGVVATPFLAAFVPLGAWSPIDIPSTLFLGVASIGPGALAGLAFVWGLRRMPAAHASTLTLLEPLVSIGIAATGLGERLSLSTVLGGTLILGASLAVMTQPASADDARRSTDRETSRRPR